MFQIDDRSIDRGKGVETIETIGGRAMGGASPRLYSAACERNKSPILEVLRSHLVKSPRLPARILELACGSGQHCAFLAGHLAKDGLVQRWFPTDLGISEKRSSVEGYVTEEPGASDVVELPARELDASHEAWAEEVKDLQLTDIYVSNLTHISPWEATVGLLSGAGKVLPPQGSVIIYGPFKVDFNHTSESNAAFDESLQSRDPRWGYRDVSEIEEEASKHGLELVQTISMPANNKTLLLRKG